MMDKKLHRPLNSRAQSHAAPLNSSSRPAVLCIGGSDSSGLAGLQADARFFEALNVHCCQVVTAVTAQNNNGVYASAISSIADCQAQLDAALALKPQAIKVGLIASIEQLNWLCEVLPKINSLPVIFDPVTIASNGQALTDSNVNKHIEKLLPHCELISPNLLEAAELSQLTIKTEKDIQKAADVFHEHGTPWVYIKGGHGDEQSSLITDIISHEQHSFALEQPRQSNNNSRGTGCALASSIAACLALAYDMVDALIIANMILAESLQNAEAINEQKGPVKACGFPKSHWPHYRELHTNKISLFDFPNCTGDNCGRNLDAQNKQSLGLYPVVDSYEWLKRLLPLGISTIQLRIKNLEASALKEEIKKSIQLAEQYQCRLFINDHWQLAIELGAYGIHLGQEDADTADLQAIAQSGLRLGISNHTHFELVRCLAINPSYIACGPVFATDSKEMPWIPHGIAGLQYWCEALAQQARPLVAIGGINKSNIADVAQCGTSGIALISAISKAKNPEAACKQLQKLIESNQSQASDSRLTLDQQLTQ